jgi:hypothetical protein
LGYIRRAPLLRQCLTLALGRLGYNTRLQTLCMIAGLERLYPHGRYERITSLQSRSTCGCRLIRQLQPSSYSLGTLSLAFCLGLLAPLLCSARAVFTSRGGAWWLIAAAWLCIFMRVLVVCLQGVDLFCMQTRRVYRHSRDSRIKSNDSLWSTSALPL